MKFLAKLGKKLYLKHSTQRESLDALFREHVGDRSQMTHSEFEKLTPAAKQQIYIECSAFVNNPVFQQVLQWEFEEQAIDTMRSAENEFQFLVGKMSVYAVENVRKRFERYASKVDDTTPESFDRLSPL